MEEIGRKGFAKLYRVPPAGLSSAERTELYRIVAITARPGYRRMYGETTNLRQKLLAALKKMPIMAQWPPSNRKSFLLAALP
jgi:hypothetical protein